MRTKSILLLCTIAVLIALALSSKGDSLGDDPYNPDTVYIDSTVSISFVGGSVPVYFYNDEELAGLSTMLTYDSPDIRIDSFSFANSRISKITTKGWQKNASGITVFCVVLNEGLIAPGRGLLGRLYFSYNPGIPAQVVAVDTTTVALDGDIEFSTIFSDAASNPFKPAFKKGYLDVKLVYCCIGNTGNVDSDPLDKCNSMDLLYLAMYLFKGGPAPLCSAEANVDGSIDGKVSSADLLYLVNYLFRGGPAPVTCP